MADVEALRALLVKVEAADGPDRELDGLIWCLDVDREPIWRDDMLLGRARTAPFDEAYVGCVFGELFKDVGRYDPYTASLDAAVALVERALPDGAWEVSRSKVRSVEATLKISRSDCVFFRCGTAATPALALCAALLRALIARAEAAGSGEGGAG